MKIVHLAIAAVLSIGSAFVAVEPAAAMPRSQAPVAAVEKSDVVQVRHRDRRYYRHHRPHYRDSWRYERRHHRDWRAERRWREHRDWRYRDRYYRPHRNGVYLRLNL
jgi:NAD(P)H-dependent flavin oxidoreductase YrpB (nitropropane dioxygenase family)